MSNFNENLAVRQSVDKRLEVWESAERRAEEANRCGLIKKGFIYLYTYLISNKWVIGVVSFFSRL